MRGLRVRGGLEGKTGACGRTVTTGSRSLMPYDSAVSNAEVPEEEIGRSELNFTARLSRPTPSEPILFLLSFCTHHNAARDTKGVYAHSPGPAPAKRMKIVVSIVSCSYLRCDTLTDGHPLQGRIILHERFEWRQGPGCARNHNSPGRSAAYHDVRGCVSPEIRRWPRPGWASACGNNLKRRRKKREREGKKGIFAFCP
jgi:hypothetical protein